MSRRHLPITLLVALPFSSLCFAQRGPTTSGPGDLASIQARVTEHLRNVSALSMELTYRIGDQNEAIEPIQLRVVMDKNRKFSVRIRANNAERYGIICDGTDITEWDSSGRRWTRYPRGLGTGRPRLVATNASDAPLRFVIARFMSSWVSEPHKYEWWLQRLQMGDEMSIVNRSESDCVLTAKVFKSNGPLRLTLAYSFGFQSFNTFFRPLFEECTVEMSPRMESLSGSGSYSITYDSISYSIPSLDAFEYHAPSDYTAVLVSDLVPVTHKLVGTNVANWKLSSLTGDPVSVMPREPRGPALVLIWATWCMPCKAELDALEKLKANGELTNVTVTAICVDKQADTLRSFLERRTMEFTVVHDPGFLERTGEGGVPVTLIIDGTGHIKDVLTGWSDSANDSEALETLRKSLGLARG